MRYNIPRFIQLTHSPHINLISRLHKAQKKFNLANISAIRQRVPSNYFHQTSKSPLYKYIRTHYNRIHIRHTSEPQT